MTDQKLDRLPGQTGREGAVLGKKVANFQDGHFLVSLLPLAGPC